MSTENNKLDLRQKLLLAAYECSNGHISTEFSFEELLVEAWNQDNHAWGLRGFENDHPDSERIHRELDSRGRGQPGLVGVGYLERVRPRVYRLTPAGLSAAAEIAPNTAEALARLDRTLELEVRRILEHPAFISWLKDPTKPDRFRDAGHFWGIAPGTPSRVVTERITRVSEVLEAALEHLKSRKIDQIGQGRRGDLMFDAVDLERCIQFQRTMRDRFEKEIALLTMAR